MINVKIIVVLLVRIHLQVTWADDVSMTMEDDRRSCTQPSLWVSEDLPDDVFVCTGDLQGWTRYSSCAEQCDYEGISMTCQLKDDGPRACWLSTIGDVGQGTSAFLDAFTGQCMDMPDGLYVQSDRYVACQAGQQVDNVTGHCLTSHPCAIRTADFTLHCSTRVNPVYGLFCAVLDPQPEEPEGSGVNSDLGGDVTTFVADAVSNVPASGKERQYKGSIQDVFHSQRPTILGHLLQDRRILFQGVGVPQMPPSPGIPSSFSAQGPVPQPSPPPPQIPASSPIQSVPVPFSSKSVQSVESPKKDEFPPSFQFSESPQKEKLKSSVDSDALRSPKMSAPFKIPSEGLKSSATSEIPSKTLFFPPSLPREQPAQITELDDILVVFPFAPPPAPAALAYPHQPLERPSKPDSVRMEADDDFFIFISDVPHVPPLSQKSVAEDETQTTVKTTSAESVDVESERLSFAMFESEERPSLPPRQFVQQPSLVFALNDDKHKDLQSLDSIPSAPSQAFDVVEDNQPSSSPMNSVQQEAHLDFRTFRRDTPPMSPRGMSAGSGVSFGLSQGDGASALSHPEIVLLRSRRDSSGPRSTRNLRSRNRLQRTKRSLDNVRERQELGAGAKSKVAKVVLDRDGNVLFKTESLSSEIPISVLQKSKDTFGNQNLGGQASKSDITSQIKADIVSIEQLLDETAKRELGSAADKLDARKPPYAVLSHNKDLPEKSDEDTKPGMPLGQKNIEHPNVENSLFKLSPNTTSHGTEETDKAQSWVVPLSSGNGSNAVKTIIKSDVNKLPPDNNAKPTESTPSINTTERTASLKVKPSDRNSHKDLSPLIMLETKLIPALLTDLFGSIFDHKKRNLTESKPNSPTLHSSVPPPLADMRKASQKDPSWQNQKETTSSTTVSKTGQNQKEAATSDEMKEQTNKSFDFPEKLTPFVDLLRELTGVKKAEVSGTFLRKSSPDLLASLTGGQLPGDSEESDETEIDLEFRIVLEEEDLEQQQEEPLGPFQGLGSVKPGPKLHPHQLFYPSPFTALHHPFPVMTHRPRPPMRPPLAGSRPRGFPGPTADFDSLWLSARKKLMSDELHNMRNHEQVQNRANLPKQTSRAPNVFQHRDTNKSGVLRNDHQTSQDPQGPVRPAPSVFDFHPPVRPPANPIRPPTNLIHPLSNPVHPPSIPLHAPIPFLSPGHIMRHPAGGAPNPEHVHPPPFAVTEKPPAHRTNFEERLLFPFFIPGFFPNPSKDGKKKESVSDEIKSQAPPPISSVNNGSTVKEQDKANESDTISSPSKERAIPTPAQQAGAWQMDRETFGDPEADYTMFVRQYDKHLSQLITENENKDMQDEVEQVNNPHDIHLSIRKRPGIQVYEDFREEDKHGHSSAEDRDRSENKVTERTDEYKNERRNSSSDAEKKKENGGEVSIKINGTEEKGPDFHDDDLMISDEEKQLIIDLWESQSEEDRDREKGAKKQSKYDEKKEEDENGKGDAKNGPSELGLVTAQPGSGKQTGGSEKIRFTSTSSADQDLKPGNRVSTGGADGEQSWEQGVQQASAGANDIFHHSEPDSESIIMSPGITSIKSPALPASSVPSLTFLSPLKKKKKKLSLKSESEEGSASTKHTKEPVFPAQGLQSDAEVQQSDAEKNAGMDSTDVLRDLNRSSDTKRPFDTETTDIQDTGKPNPFFLAKSTQAPSLTRSGLKTEQDGADTAVLGFMKGDANSKLGASQDHNTDRPASLTQNVDSKDGGSKLKMDGPNSKPGSQGSKIKVPNSVLFGLNWGAEEFNPAISNQENTPNSGMAWENGSPQGMKDPQQRLKIMHKRTGHPPHAHHSIGGHG